MNTAESIPTNKYNLDEFIVPQEPVADKPKLQSVDSLTPEEVATRVAEQQAKAEKTMSHSAKMLADMQRITENEYPVSKRILSISRRTEGWIDRKAQASAEKSRAKSASKKDGNGRGKLATEILAIGNEIKWRSGVQTLIGGAAIFGVATGGLGLAAGGTLLAVRTAHRTMRGVYEGDKRLREDRAIGDKVEVGPDASRVAKISTGISNLASKPERFITKKTLGSGEYTTRRRATSHVLGALAIPGFVRGIRDVADLMTGVAGAQATTARDGIVGSADKPATLNSGLTGSADKPEGIGLMGRATTPATSGEAAPTATTPDTTTSTRGGGAAAPSEGEASASTASKPAGSSSPDSEKAGYNKHEAHKMGDQFLSSRRFTEGFEDRTTAENEKLLADLVTNRPGSLAAFREEMLHSNKDFSVDRVNDRNEAYAVHGKNGTYTETGGRAAEKAREAIEGAREMKFLSSAEVRELQSRFSIRNHGITEGQYKNAVDDRIYDAGEFRLKPGEKILRVIDKDGKEHLFKCSENEDGDCLNPLSLEKKSPVVETPPTTTTPPADNPPGMRKHPKQPPLYWDQPPKPGEKPPVPEPGKPPVTPPTETPPVDNPPEEPPVEPPEVVNPKDPTKDINVNPSLPPQVQMGDQAGTIPAGPPTTPTAPPDVYTPPAPPAPVQPPAPPVAPPTPETPAPTPTTPGGTTPNPF